MFYERHFELVLRRLKGRRPGVRIWEAQERTFPAKEERTRCHLKWGKGHLQQLRFRDQHNNIDIFARIDYSEISRVPLYLSPYWIEHI